MNLNKVLLAGRLTRDPQLRYTPNGTAVCDIGLAVNRVFTDASGQRREETCYVECVLWKRQAEVCAKHLRKGSPIFIEGRLTYESWEGSDGQRRSRLKVVGESFQFMDSPQDRRAAESGTAAAPVTPPGGGEPEEAFPEADVSPAEPPTGADDEIPF